MISGFVIRCLIVTIAAAVVAWLPMAILLTLDMETNLALYTAPKLFLLSLTGSALIGLPAALLLLRSLDRPSLRNLLAWANAFGALLVFVTFVWGHAFGAILIGVPCVVAANAFALLGWLIVVPAQRGSAYD